MHRDKTWYSYVNVWVFLLETIKIFFGLFLASNITALYIKVIIVCAPVIILVLSIYFNDLFVTVLVKCCNRCIHF